MGVSGESDHWVRHTHEVLGKSSGFALSPSRVWNRAMRGYVLTGNESYVESYRADVVKGPTVSRPRLRI